MSAFKLNTNNGRIYFGGIPKFNNPRGSVASPYDPSSIIIFNNMDIDPDEDRKVAIDTLVRGLKTDGNWNLIDALWFPASHTEQAGKLNWKNPALHLLNPIGSPVHTVDRGYDFDASTQYLRTNYTPDVDGVNYTLDDASFGFYSGDNSFGGYAMGVDSSQRASMFLDSLQIQARINGATAETIAIADTLGLFVTKRTSSSDIEVWKDGVSIGASAANNSAGVPTLEMAIAASNAGPGFAGHSDRMIRFAFFGGGGIDVALLYARVQTYLYTIAAIDSEAETLITAMSVPPSLDRKIAISDFIKGCKADGNWTLMDACWFTAAHTEQAGKLNWKNTAAYTLIATNSPTHTVDRGYDFDGTTQYLNTNFAPLADGVNYSLNLASLGVYSTTNVDGGYVIGTTIDSGDSFIALGAGYTYSTRINATGGASAILIDSLGLLASKRSSSNNVDLYKRDVIVGFTVVSSSISLSSGKLYISALNTGSVTAFSSRRIAFSFIGGNVNIPLLYARVQTYLTVLGAQV